MPSISPCLADRTNTDGYAMTSFGLMLLLNVCNIISWLCISTKRCVPGKSAGGCLLLTTSPVFGSAGASAKMSPCSGALVSTGAVSPSSVNMSRARSAWRFFSASSLPSFSAFSLALISASDSPVSSKPDAFCGAAVPRSARTSAIRSGLVDQLSHAAFC